MGRWPNTGYRIYTSHSGNSSITDATLTGNWTGAEVVIRKNRWITDRHTITSGSTRTITYNTNTTDEPLKNTNNYSPSNGFGYFIQNSLATLDTLGEWYFDRKANKIYMYFGAKAPSIYSVKASTVNTLLESFRANSAFVNIDFEGANYQGVYLYNTQNITFSGCKFSEMGGYAMRVVNSSDVSIINCSINDCASNGFDITANHTNITNLTSSDISMKDGLMYGGDGRGFSVRVDGDNSLITKSSFIHNGYIAIGFHGSNTTVNDNYVDGYCYTKDDGGGIYSFTGKDDSPMQIQLSAIILFSMDMGQHPVMD